jgi:adenosylcobyric acid synthase
MGKEKDKWQGNGGRGKGALFIVGTGPGGLKELTARAVEVLTRVDVVVGYSSYLELVIPLIEGKEVLASGMGQEVERCRKAVELARGGRAVALVSGGDPGVYGMAGLALQTAGEFKGDFADIEVVPGLPAFVSAASVLGAPLVHDFASISLSDLLTPWEVIERRVAAAVGADFVIVFYNPRSSQRTTQLPAAVEILLRQRPSATPVGIVKNSSRADEDSLVTTLLGLANEYESIDMSTIVIVGNSESYVESGRIITPRGYKGVGPND